jgi:endonuclease/exonuclease/phosphatase family metal-dependent hydrolase
MIAFALFFLFLVQLAGILVESIYILDLMNTSLDAKALGLLFFFTPILLLPIRRKIPNGIIWLLFALLFVSRGATPYLNTLGRMLASGLGTGAVLLLFPFLVASKPKDKSNPQIGFAASTGLALAVGLSVFFRTVNFSIDYSLTPAGGWVGWGLGLLFGWTLTQLNWNDEVSTPRSNWKVVSALPGIFLVLILVYFAFSAPAVIARWTQGNYFQIVMTISLLSLGWVFLVLGNSSLPNRIPPSGLMIWNLLFTLSLTANLLAHRVSFPQTPDASAVVVGNPNWIQQIPLVLMLLLFPVIFLDLRLFFNTLQQENPSPRAMIPGVLVGSGVLVLLVFINIFTNVWGYIQPVSGIFRNQYFLPYFLIAAGMTLLAWKQKRIETEPFQLQKGSAPIVTAILLGIILLGTTAGLLRAKRIPFADPNKTSLTAMTYNIQQANDDSGERSYERQLALIQKVSPDILSLQETDSARISLNNNDYFRYYADSLGYYSYYGPSTVAGTFGTAILSRYPLQNPRSVFTFSDTDEIGTAEAEIEVGGLSITIYDVHPDGSDTAKLVFAKSLLERAGTKTNVIVLGDYNLRDYEDAYQLIDNVLINAWTSVYPSKIGADGTDMSGKNRIDHIFISPSLKVRNPVYILPPDSATDHPVHWAEVYWEE